jgi:hypothetical protein
LYNDPDQGRLSFASGKQVNESRPTTDGTRTAVGPSGACAKLLAPRAEGVPRTKPATLTYGLEEQPPPVVIWISAVQHVGVIAIAIIYPLIIARQAGLTSD